MNVIIIYLLLLHPGAARDARSGAPVGIPFAAYASQELCEVKRLYLIDERKLPERILECVPTSLVSP